MIVLSVDKIDDAKQELVKRYKYIYENSFLMLSPFVEKNKLSKNNDVSIKVPTEFKKLLEEFLLTDKKMENTPLYRFIEIKKKDKAYLEEQKKVLMLLDKSNEGKTYLKTNLDIWKILDIAGAYLEDQSGDLRNKERKLKVLDEYYKIARYKNNGDVLTSGRNLNIHDCNSILIPKKKEPSRDKTDIGIRENPFTVSIDLAPRHKENNSIFTEKEKQLIYLQYNDELPHDLELTCGYTEQNLSSENERLKRPSSTFPCGENFTVKEEEIFVNPCAKYNRYYEVCPNCGFIVNVPSEMLSEKIRKRIEHRYIGDDKLFRKMMLYSELLGLDYNSYKDQKKMIKKK